MEWNVKIEGEKKQRVKFVFDPLKEEIRVYGQYNVGQNRWEKFSEANKVFVSTNEKYTITLDDLQELMLHVIKQMRPRIKEYENLSEGFTVLKEVAFVDESTEDEQP